MAATFFIRITHVCTRGKQGLLRLYNSRKTVQLTSGQVGTRRDPPDCPESEPLPAGTSRQRDGETIETVTDFIFLGSKITADGDCSHEIKRRMLLGRKAMTNLDSILRSRDITLLAK